MQTFGWAKVAVALAKDDPYAAWYREAFEHAGLRPEVLEGISAGEIARHHILILCGNGKLHEEQVEAVTDWVRKGGHLVCCGSAWNLHEVLGLHKEHSHLSNAVAVPCKRDPMWPDGMDKVRFFGGQLRKGAGCDVVARIGADGVALSRRKLVKGSAVYVAAHVGQTLKLMMMGRSVETDGIGPCDGSARLDDGVLRAEDGGVLDFDRDRVTVDGCDTPFFGLPHADAVREMLIRAIVHSATTRGLCVPLIWHWPDNAHGTAVLTVDSEDFDRENVNKLYRVLSMFGAQATWLVGMPGYAADVYRAMRNWGHEVGLLFHTDDGPGWNEERLKIQLTSIGRLAGHANLATSRAKEGRWRGWSTFYELCETGGARVSVSKGGRQPGTSGFLFGTCHPFIPLRRNGSHFLTTELPYTIYSPGSVTPDPVAEAIAYQTAARHGCLHICWPSGAIASATSGAALRRLLSISKQLRFEFMLPEQIHRFERARRQIRVSERLFDDEGILLLTSDNQIEGLTLLFTGSRVGAEIDGKEASAHVIERYGVPMTVVRLDLEAKKQSEVRLHVLAEAKVA